MEEQKTTAEYLFDFLNELMKVFKEEKQSEFKAIKTLHELCQKYATLIDLAQLIRKDK